MLWFGFSWTDFTTLLEEDGLRSRTKGLTKSFLQGT